MGLLSGPSFALSAAQTSSPVPATGPTELQVVADWPKPLPNGWITGEVAATCVDSQDHLFIVNRSNLTETEMRVGVPAPSVIEFDVEGNVVNAWTAPVMPNGLHGCFIDHEDNLWIGGNGDAIVQKYTHDGSQLLLQIGTRGLFDSSDGSADGEALNSSHELLNRPADIAVDPENGDIYIADGYGNHRIVVFDSSGQYLRQWGEAATQEEADQGVGGKFLATVHAVSLGQDGNVYVNDRKGDRIQVFDKMGGFLRNIWISPGTGAGAGTGSAWDTGFSVDPDQSIIYNTDGENQVLWFVGRESGEILGQLGQPGHNAGQFTYIHTVAVDSQNTVYTAETIGGRRVQKFVPAQS
jgi:DNA-binding beta-propeller fold protein YncE